MKLSRALAIIAERDMRGWKSSAAQLAEAERVVNTSSRVSHPRSVKKGHKLCPICDHYHANHAWCKKRAGK